jgi:hypothetical protein
MTAKYLAKDFLARPSLRTAMESGLDIRHNLATKLFLITLLKWLSQGML